MTSRFERLVATLDYPLYVVTTALEQQPAGCLIGFATQCSIHPPRFLPLRLIQHATLGRKLTLELREHWFDGRTQGFHNGIREQ